MSYQDSSSSSAASSDATASCGGAFVDFLPPSKMSESELIHKMNSAAEYFESNISSDSMGEMPELLQTIESILTAYRTNGVVVVDSDNNKKVVGSEVPGMPLKPLPEAGAGWVEIPVKPLYCDEFSDSIMGLHEWYLQQPNSLLHVKKSKIKRVIRLAPMQNQIGAHLTVGYIQKLPYTQLFQALIQTGMLDILDQVAKTISFKPEASTPFGVSDNFTAVVSEATEVFSNMPDNDLARTLLFAAWTRLCTAYRFWIAVKSSGKTVAELEEAQSAGKDSLQKLGDLLQSFVKGTFLAPKFHSTLLDGSGDLRYLVQLMNLAALLERSDQDAAKWSTAHRQLKQNQGEMDPADEARADALVQEGLVASTEYQRILQAPMPGLASRPKKGFKTLCTAMDRSNEVSTFVLTAGRFLCAPKEMGHSHFVFRTASVRDESGTELPRDTFVLDLSSGEITINALKVDFSTKVTDEMRKHVRESGSSDVTGYIANMNAMQTV